MAESLCASCSGFIKSIGEVEDANWRSKLEVAPNIHSLRSQARNGCPLCQIIYRFCFYVWTMSWKSEDCSIAISASPPLNYDPGNFDYVEYCKMVNDTEEEDGLPFRNLHVRGLEIYVTCAKLYAFYLPVITNDHGTQRGFGMCFPHPPYAILDPSLPQDLQRIIQLAEEWLLACRSGHIGCRHSGSSAKNLLPTRLIYVGSQGETMPRLHISDHDTDTRVIEYAALSYAWGSDHASFAKTTASNLNDMRAQIPWNQLSKTIQDAITITRGLGLKYIWVDALCVLQKEKINDIQHMEDWSIEAARFASYYQNAVLTIAATGSDSSSRGLFIERPGLEFNPEPVVVTQKSYWTGFRESTIQPPCPKPRSEIRISALLNRGWTTQERILSERILHFGANCIFWECSGGYASETNPDFFDSTGQETSDFFEFKNIHTHNTGELAKIWYTFVAGYSTKDFSIASDRLPALSGVATLVSDRCQQKYIAGIWESSVAEGLTWVAIDTSDIHSDDPIIDTQCVKLESQMGERVLPSWSWASNNGRVHFLFDNSPYVSFIPPWEPMIQVKDFRSISKGPDTSGQILEARLTLRGLFRMVDLSQLKMKYPRNKHAQEESPESNHEDTDKHEHFAYMDGVKPARPISTHPRLCLLVGAIHELEYEPWDKVKMGVACVLEHSGRCYGEFEGYKRIGIVSLPFDEYWSEVKDVRTIELV